MSSRCPTHTEQSLADSGQWPPHQVHVYKYLCIFHYNLNPSEPCREASVPQPDKFFESSENSLSVHLGGWQDANCPTVYFIVEQRWWSLICSWNRNKCFISLSQRERGKEEWSSVSRSAKPGADIVISNLSPATWYQIKVLHRRKRIGSIIGNSGDWGGARIFTRAKPHFS